MPAQINILDEIIVDNFAGDGGGREETMKRLTTDHPESNVELAMNLAYVKDSEVWLRLYPDMSLCEYAAAACARQGCGDMTPESIMEDGLNDCDDCPVAIAYAAAIQAAELRERLKAYEDAGLSPELSRLALMYDDLSEPLPDGGPAPVVVLDPESHAALHAGRDYEAKEADEPVICTEASPVRVRVLRHQSRAGRRPELPPAGSRASVSRRASPFSREAVPSDPETMPGLRGQSGPGGEMRLRKGGAGRCRR